MLFVVFLLFFGGSLFLGFSRLDEVADGSDLGVRRLLADGTGRLDKLSLRDVEVAGLLVLLVDLLLLPAVGGGLVGEDGVDDRLDLRDALEEGFLGSELALIGLDLIMLEIELDACRSDELDVSLSFADLVERAGDGAEFLLLFFLLFDSLVLHRIDKSEGSLGGFLFGNGGRLDGSDLLFFRGGLSHFFLGRFVSGDGPAFVESGVCRLFEDVLVDDDLFIVARGTSGDFIVGMLLFLRPQIVFCDVVDGGDDGFLLRLLDDLGLRGFFDSLFFFRTSNGVEVDLMQKRPEGMKLFEIKSSMSMNNDFLKGMNYYKTRFGAYSTSVIYAGLNVPEYLGSSYLDFHDAYDQFSPKEEKFRLSL